MQLESRRDKIQVVYKEMPCDGAKFNVIKWNFIGRIQFITCSSCIDRVCSKWTLDVVVIVRDGMCVVRKGAVKHVLTVK